MSKKNLTTIVPLSEPIKVDGKEIKSVTLRKPKGGDLRGLALSDILRMDTNAMHKLFPRISEPHLSPEQVSSDIDVADFTSMAVATVAFFVPSDQLQAAT